MNHTVRNAIGSWLDSVEPATRHRVRHFPLARGRSATDPTTAAAIAQAKDGRQRRLEARRQARALRQRSEFLLAEVAP